MYRRLFVFLAPLIQTLLLNMDGQVPASPGQNSRNPFSEDLQARGKEREINSSLIAGKKSFVWAPLEGDNYIRMRRNAARDS